MLHLVLAAVTPAPVPDPAVVDPYIVSVLAGIVVPLLTGLITKLGAADAVKAVTAMALSAVLAGINVVVTTSTWDWRQFLLLLGTTFTASLIAYKAAWKPFGGGVSDPVSIVTAKVGIGRPVVDRFAHPDLKAAA